MNKDEFMKKGTGDVLVKDYLDILASSEAVPGGGGASGLVAALAAALGSMVCNLTYGKKKYAEYQDEIEGLLDKCNEYIRLLIEAADEDAVCFEPLSRAYSLPKDTEEEIAYRNKVLEEKLEIAARAPLKMMELIYDLLKLLDRLSDIGSRLAISDVGVAAYFAKASVNTASLNVYINTGLMKNKTLSEELNKKAEEIVDKCDRIGDSVFDKVKKELK